jgi:hypothetical protein
VTGDFHAQVAAEPQPRQPVRWNNVDAMGNEIADPEEITVIKIASKRDRWDEDAEELSERINAERQALQQPFAIWVSSFPESGNNDTQIPQWERRRPDWGTARSARSAAGIVILIRANGLEVTSCSASSQAKHVRERACGWPRLPVGSCR